MPAPISRRDFALALTAPAAPAINPPNARFLSALRDILDTASVPAIGMAVVQNGRAVWSHYQGVKDVRSGESVDAKTLWPAASLSKPVFAYAALRLVDQGALDLDRPLESYVPDHAPDDARGNTITARHVLSLRRAYATGAIAPTNRSCPTSSPARVSNILERVSITRSAWSSTSRTWASSSS